MFKKRLYNQNENDELEELGEDSELKELGDDDLDGSEDLKTGEDETPETEDLA